MDRTTPPAAAGPPAPWPGLSDLPLAWKIVLTVVLLFLAAGYVAALANIYAQNERVDGQPGLSPRDLILKYAGGDVRLEQGQAAPSRMLEMIQGAMRQYFSDDASYRVLYEWLKAGASEEAFTRTRDDLSPQDVIIADCLRCHAADSGEQVGTKSPFGPDQFTPDYKQIAKFALPHEPGQQTVHREPVDWRDLAMSSHAHLLSVPMFLILLATLFLWAGWPPGADRRSQIVRGLLAALPLTAFLLDVACWWLARLPGVGPVFALTIAGTGALFGLGFAVQWLVVLRTLWSRGA